MLMWVVRFILVAIEVMTLCNLSTAWNAYLVSGDAYRISLILIAALALFTFVLTLLTDEEEKESTDVVVKKVRLTDEQAKQFMKLVESFKFDDENGKKESDQK